MDIYKAVFDFAASAGALEGYVFPDRDIAVDRLVDWVDNLTAQYRALPADVTVRFQPALDRTLGRACLSLAPVLGENHAIIGKLRGLVQGEPPEAHDDFGAEIREKKSFRRRSAVRR